MNITRFSIKRPIGICMIYALLCVLGFISYFRIGVELLPEVDSQFVSVIVSYPGASTESVEQQVTKPIEEELSSISHFKQVRSATRPGRSEIFVELDPDADADLVAIEATKKVSRIRKSLPDDISEPVVLKRSSEEYPIIQLAVTGTGALDDIYSLADSIFKERLQQANGVADVAVSGGREKEIAIEVDKERLNSYGLTLQDVISAVKKENVIISSGSVYTASLEKTVRMDAQFQEPKELEQIVLRGSSQTVELGQVARIVAKDKRDTTYSRVDGTEAVSLEVYKASGANIVDTAESVMQQLAKLKQAYPEYVFTVVYDQSHFVKESLSNTLHTLLEGLVTTGLVLFLFLRGWRSSMAVMIAIPMSLIATFFLMYMAGFTFNMMSLMGMSLCIGILVDDSIVVLENIETKEKIKTGLKRALESIIRRNIAPDYTNISVIGCMNLVSSGELLEDERYFNIGKKRLKKLLEYTKFNTAFSEYNSSDYALLDIEEISRMLDFFKDVEARQMAEELNHYAWDMLTSHFNTHINQLSPPQSRAYIDLEKGRINALIYLGTKGKHGKLNSIDKVEPPWLIVGLSCPAECEKNLEQTGERWIDHTYYRKNSIITPDEERAIITDNDCPDMTARTYMTDKFSIGSFSASDLWKQRRTCMVLWGKDKPCYLRLRGMKDNNDFCSAMVYASQYKNTVLANLGFATDRGANHYIVDDNKSGIYNAEKLYFKFELGGNTEAVTVSRIGNDFLFTDGEITVKLCIHKWVYDGKAGEIRYDEKEKCVELICFKDDNHEFDLNKLVKTYGVFSLSVNEINENAPEIEERENMVFSSLKINQNTLKVSSNYKPIKFNEAVEKSISVSEEGGY